MKKAMAAWKAAILAAAVVTSETLPADAQSNVPHAAPHKVALVVQNHTSDAPTLPMAAFADTLTSRLSGKTFRIVNPHNVIGVNQNRTARGEAMPEASAQEIGRMLGADGIITASIQEFTGEDIGVPAIAHTLKVRLALNLADAATGETICGVDGVELSKNYTVEKVKSDTATLYEGLMHAAAAKGAEKLLTKVASVGWEKNDVKTLNVFFGCNVLGADVQIDGLSYGTCPAQLSLTPGIHNLLVSYPPYYLEFKRRAMFNQEGQTFKVVLQITPEGEKQRVRALEYMENMATLKNEQREDDLEYEREKAELDADKKKLGLEYEKKKQELEDKRASRLFELKKKKKNLDSEIAERCALFNKQLELADAMLDRYQLSGDADDYVRKTIAKGTATYWKNSFGRIAITEGEADNIEFATPSTDAGDLSVPPDPSDISQGIQKLLMKRVGK